MGVIARVLSVLWPVVWIAPLLALWGCEKAPGDMVPVPAGEFVMGSDDIDTEDLAKTYWPVKVRFYEDERPVRKVYIEDYYIDMYEVTNGRYKEFVEAAGYAYPSRWKGGVYPDGKADHPATDVSWYDAEAYCAWAGKRLPTEEEWEKAARGTDGRVYPWGNEYDKSKANIDTGRTEPVGNYETDVSPYGVYDMGGSVMEWVDAWYEPYPGNEIGNSKYGKREKVLRGGFAGIPGHYMISRIFSRASFRRYAPPTATGDDGGFRCAKSAGKG